MVVFSPGGLDPSIPLLPEVTIKETHVRNIYMYLPVPCLGGLQELPSREMAPGQLQRKFPPIKEVICNLQHTHTHSFSPQRFRRVLRTAGWRAQLFHQAVRVRKVRLVERLGARVGKPDPRHHTAQQ